ncbi:MAG TPA: hypothetical protein DCX54_10800, partial [Flavobacteriales bacterium]|nr:hypothetical protein [Flavobacteriales bacterium]
GVGRQVEQMSVFGKQSGIRRHKVSKYKKIRGLPASDVSRTRSRGGAYSGGMVVPVVWVGFLCIVCMAPIVIANGED